MSRMRAWWMGFCECASDAGLTWDTPDHPLSRAYDNGRAWGCLLRGNR